MHFVISKYGCLSRYFDGVFIQHRGIAGRVMPVAALFKDILVYVESEIKIDLNANTRSPFSNIYGIGKWGCCYMDIRILKNQHIKS